MNNTRVNNLAWFSFPFDYYFEILISVYNNLSKVWVSQSGTQWDIKSKSLQMSAEPVQTFVVK